MADELRVPRVVLDEIRVRDNRAANRVETAAADWLVVADHDVGLLPELIWREAGAGEAATMAVALENNAVRIVLDDLDARRWARRLGLHPIGTLGILLAARLRNEISSVSEPIDRLRSMGFRASEALVASVLREAGED